MSGFKRTANVPPVARLFAGTVSKADLLEAAWHLAGLASEGYGNDGAHLARLVEEIQAIRANAGRKPLKVVHRKNMKGPNIDPKYLRMHEDNPERCPACVLEAHAAAIAKETA
jgi:hypothetical protein